MEASCEDGVWERCGVWDVGDGGSVCDWLGVGTGVVGLCDVLRRVVRGLS